MSYYIFRYNPAIIKLSLHILLTSTTDVCPVKTVLALITLPSCGVVLMSQRQMVYKENIY